ncbi:hypothetical protein Tco_0011039 [Tanacetum coccineum]
MSMMSLHILHCYPTILNSGMLEEILVQQDLNQVVEIPQVIIDEQLVLDMIVDEKLMLDMIVDEQLVLHMLVVVEEVNRIVVVGEMLKIVDCTVMDDWCRLENGPHVAIDMHVAD